MHEWAGPVTYLLMHVSTKYDVADLWRMIAHVVVGHSIAAFSADSAINQWTFFSQSPVYK